jgi:osmotically-inducible protein OsmY
MRRLVVGLAIVSLAALALSWAQADDQEIAKEITERLKREQTAGTLHDFNINLKVADGQVLMKGHVASSEQQQLALDVARSAKGVKRVVNDLEIQAAAPAVKESLVATPVAETTVSDSALTDTQIGERITAELMRRKDTGELKGFGLGLSVTKGLVVLRGRVANEEQLQTALDIAKRTPGVRDVVHHVVVSPPTASADCRQDGTPAPAGKDGTALDDEIAQHIATAVNQQKMAGKLKGFDIDLSVQDAVVVYAGQVADAEQMQLALGIAHQTPGVREVVNNLIVAAGPAPVAARPPASNDANIARRIAATLREEKAAGRLKEFSLDVGVKDGVVTYVGRVSQADQIPLVTKLARETPGVKDVVSQITVTTTPQAAPEPQAQPVNEAAPAPEAKPATPTDSEIARRLAATLKQRKAAGNLKDFDIALRVKDGVVTYEGRVSGSEQMQLALAAARSTAGVRDVVNNLIVTEPTPAVTEPTPAREMPSAPQQTRVVTTKLKDPLSPDESAQPPEQVLPVQTAMFHNVQSAAASLDPMVEDRRIGDELTAKLQTAKRNGSLRGFGIGVQVDHHNVWLRGRVASDAQRQLAMDLAQSVAGVGQITNELTLEAPAPTPDMIAQELRQRLQIEDAKGMLRGSNVDAQIDNGCVRMKGTVATESQRDTLIEIARRVPGVQKVVDELVVAAPGLPTAVPVGYPAPLAAPTLLAGNVPTANGQVLNPAPLPLGTVRSAAYMGGAALAAPVMAINQAAEAVPSMPAALPGPGYSQVPSRYDHPNLPGYAWPSYAAHPNYAAVTYPKQYSPTAWPYIGPFYPYPQVPPGWRKVALKWKDGWWMLDFKSK